MTKNVLVVEDEKDVIDVLNYFLQKEEYRVHVATDGVAALELAGKVIPNLILLDLGIPKMDGIEVCRRLKSDNRLSQIPIIMVTAKGDEEDKISGLDLGADDYITKPFNPKELLARVRAQMRSRDPHSHEKQIQYGSLLIDTVKREVTCEGKEVVLTAKEFELLLYMVENQGKVLTRDMILNHVWGHDYYGTTRTVDVHVTHLRHKISILSGAITTVKPLGYKLKEHSLEI